MMLVGRLRVALFPAWTTSLPLDAIGGFFYLERWKVRKTGITQWND
jgi:hypothetical protein